MDEIAKPFGENRPLQLMALWLVAFWIVTAIHPLYPIDWILENLLAYIFVAALFATHRRFRFSTLSYGLMTIFLTLHMIGAHYTYAHAPMGYWMEKLLGFSRNDYDRVVHFSFGLLFSVPAREVVIRIMGVPMRWSRVLVVIMILSFGAFYELLEMWTAIIVSPKLGIAYLGTQGDVWDTQNDMFMALVGSIIAMILDALRRKTVSA